MDLIDIFSNQLHKHKLPGVYVMPSALTPLGRYTCSVNYELMTRGR